jgi:hypothetical protein
MHLYHDFYGGRRKPFQEFPSLSLDIQLDKVFYCIRDFEWLIKKKKNKNKKKQQNIPKSFQTHISGIIAKKKKQREREREKG